MTEATVVPVSGMTCGSCVSRISRTLRKLEGVERFRVDLAAETLTVELDPARVSLLTVALAVAAAGYELNVAAARPAARIPLRLLERLSLAWSQR